MKLREGERVEAVHFSLDVGLRIWPVFEHGTPAGVWRVVRVDGSGPDAAITELDRGTSAECQARHPDATFGINDNETVPPGTPGTVEHVSELQTFVRWDNGARLAFSAHDRYRKL